VCFVAPNPLFVRISGNLRNLSRRSLGEGGSADRAIGCVCSRAVWGIICLFVLFLLGWIWLASHLFAGAIYAREKAALSRIQYQGLRTFSVAIAGVGFSLLAAPKTFGQTIAPAAMTAPSPTPAEANAEAERVIVTGSNIPTAQEVGPNPVDILTRDRIDKAGERTTAELVRNLTVAGPNGVPTSNNGAGLTPGASSIALRGFDASSTLVLIDGRRVAPYPLGTDNGAVTFVDLNSIPKPALDSIEILKDGASSIYGADAVAGVVNFKLRHDYRGAEVNVEYGNTLDKDSGEFASSVIFGVGDGDTDITGVMNYYHRNSIFNHDRGYSNTVRFTPSNNASPLNLQLSRDAVLAAGVPPTVLPDDRDTFFGHAPFFTNGNAPATDYSYTPRRSVFFNFNRYAEALPDSERYGGFVNFDHKICGDQLLVYGDFFYQNVKTSYDLAASATGDFQTPGDVTLAIPPRSDLNGAAPPNTPRFAGQPAGVDAEGNPIPGEVQTNTPANAFNPFNPFNQIISGGTRARLFDFGKRVIDNQTDAFFSTLGVKGDKLFDGNWGYDASFRYSQVQNISTDTHVSASRFNRILNAGDPIFDPASSQFIGTTIPYNPFGDYRVPIPSNAEVVGFAVVHPKEIDFSKLATVDLNIYTTSLFQLPAGGVGLAFGGQFRRETLEQKPDDLLVMGDLISTAPANFTHAGRKTYAFYAEARLPVFGGDFTAPGLHALEFTAAARFEDFLDNDTNVLVPKFGVRWQPFDDSLTVRATWGEGFHEPSLIELFGIPIQGITAVHDPVTDTDVPGVPFITRSNPNLQPEDSRSFTAGIVYTPKFVTSLTLTIDLYDIESTGRTIIPDFQNVVNRSVTGNLLPGETIVRNPDNEIILLENAFQNAGSQKARGVDFGLSYQVETRFGTLTWLTQATYLDSFQFAQLAGESEKELRSKFRHGLQSHDDSFLKWRANSQIDWAWKGFDLALTAHYLDGFHEIVSFIAKGGGGHPHPVEPREHYVKETWFFDVRASYQFQVPSAPQAVAGYAKDTTSSGKERQPEGSAQMANCTWQRLLNDTTITLGCNNVFGHDPPTAAATANYADFIYDSTGRFVYLSLTKRF
jgi:iron complex outermembrane recepter protein